MTLCVLESGYQQSAAYTALEYIDCNNRLYIKHCGSTCPQIFMCVIPVVCVTNKEGGVEISTPTPPYQFILILLISVKPDDGRFWPKHVVS